MTEYAHYKKESTEISTTCFRMAGLKKMLIPQYQEFQNSEFYVREYQSYEIKKCLKISEYPCVYVTVELYVQYNRRDLATIIKYDITN